MLTNDEIKSLFELGYDEFVEKTILELTTILSDMDLLNDFLYFLDKIESSPEVKNDIKTALLNIRDKKINTILDEK